MAASAAGPNLVGITAVASTSSTRPCTLPGSIRSVWFSILQRRLLRYGSFDGIADLREQVLAFIRYWNRFEAHPFNWKFSGKFVRTTSTAVAA